MTRFQCELCHFCNIMNRSPVLTFDLDLFLLEFIVIANLTSEEAFLWVLTAPLLLFKDSVLFSTESDNLIKNPTIIRRLGHK
jgi:hypothetical protein